MLGSNHYRFCIIILLTIFFISVFLTFTLIQNFYQSVQELAHSNNLANNFLLDPSGIRFHASNKFEGEKLVHIDLKGAPPKISYLKEIFAFIGNLGATGILLEYEDMFPYRDNLKEISSLNAYSLSDVNEIKKSAESNNLSVIPLIQTFGHLEYVLKLGKFRHLREVDNSPEVICPNHRESKALLYEMIDQIMATHPTSNYLHIGCDEVTKIGFCKKCYDILKNFNYNEKKIFFSHIKNVAEYINNRYPNVRPIIWADQIVSENEKLLMDYEIPKLLDIMVWNYATNMLSFLNAKDFTCYAKLFKTIWIASAFKGSMSINQIIASPEHYLKNNYLWMDLVDKWKNQINFKGIVMTGWSRYHHFSTLSELLPVSVPSLALNLLFLNNLNEKDLDVKLKFALNCNNLLPLKESELLDEKNFFMPPLKCKFPGSFIFIITVNYVKYMKRVRSSLITNNDPSFSFYRVFLNASYINNMEFSLKILLKNLDSIKKFEVQIKDALAEACDEYAISEWLMTHLKPQKFYMEALANILKKISKVRVWPRGPLYMFNENWEEIFEKICNSSDLRGCTFLTPLRT